MKKTILIIFVSLFACNVFGQKSDCSSLLRELESLYNPDYLPYYEDGIIEQVSSYDRTGGNDDGFSGKYSYIRKEGDKLILADFKGPGVINRIWTPTPTSDTIQFYIDDEIEPSISIPFIDLFSGNVYPFVNPICGNEVGGYYCYIPIQFAKSCKIAFCGEKIMFHQIQYRPYTKKDSVKSFSMTWTEDERKTLFKACEYWKLHRNPLSYLDKSGLLVETRHFFISPGESIPFFTSDEGGRIKGFELDFGSAIEGDNKDVILKAQWDNDEEPAIYSPVADYFGYAYGKPSMRSILLGSHQGVNYSYFSMPYQNKAELSLIYKAREDEKQSKIEVSAKVYYAKVPQNPKNEGKLYTVWRREINPSEGKPYLFIDHNDKGHYVGIIHLAQALTPGMTLFFEGDDVTTVDGKMRIHGTGSEDYYNGGWYALLDRWDRGVSLPIHGSLDYSLPMARTGGYRLFLSDKVTFNENLNITMEHGPEGNKFPVDYTSVAFYYGSKPSSSRIKPTEELRTVYHPSTHVFFPQLMNLSVSNGMKIDFRGDRLVAEVENESMFRILLDEVPEGNYKVKLTYFKTPESGSFEVWNRQNKIKELENVYNHEELKKDDVVLGVFDLTRHTNSLSIKVKKTDNGSQFHMNTLTLERQD